MESMKEDSHKFSFNREIGLFYGSADFIERLLFRETLL